MLFGFYYKVSEFIRMPHQEPLAISLPDKLDFSTFVEGDNPAAVSMIKDAVGRGAHEFFYIFGPKGCGKTHFLNALFNTSFAQNNHCFFMDLQNVRQLGTECLGVPLSLVILLDNVDCIAKDEECELALFRFFNRWYDKKEGTLVISGEKSPDAISFLKKDLNTRLSSGVSFKFEYLDEHACVRALLKRAALRQIRLSEHTASFMVRHFNHDMTSLVALLDRLEKQEIAERHNLTIPFVKNFLNLK